MKRLVTALACLAMLTFSGCAGGILGGVGNSGCNDQPSLFGNGGLFADGPIRQFIRGDACDSCNTAAGQLFPHQGPNCDTCGSIVNGGGFPLPGSPLASQPTTSFYPTETVDASFPQQQFFGAGESVPPIPGGISNGIGIPNGGAVLPSLPGSLGTDLTVPPAGVN